MVTPAKWGSMKTRPDVNVNWDIKIKSYKQTKNLAFNGNLVFIRLKFKTKVSLFQMIKSSHIFFFYILDANLLVY